MKKLLSMACMLLALSCGSKDDSQPVDPPAPPVEQRVECALTSPAPGAEVDMTGVLTIRGEGSVNDGSIREVRLVVGGERVADVTGVPFVYEHRFSSDCPEGDMRIELYVEGDRGASGTSEVTVRLTRPEEPVPPVEQRVECALTFPAPGAEVDITGVLTIRGEGSVNDGSIREVRLVVGGERVADVTGVPFVYEHRFSSDCPEGDMRIELYVEGDRGASGSSEVTVYLTRPEEPAPPLPGEQGEIDSAEENRYGEF